MKDLIDIHCHILPGVDDGAKDIYEAVEMLKNSYNSGVRTIIATPHFKLGKFEADYNTCKNAFENLKVIAQDENIKMNILLGSEIYYSDGVLREVIEKKVHTMADSKYILLEFSYRAEYAMFLQGINEAFSMGFIPIIAHIERYECLYSDINKACELAEQGALIQVNAGSILGENGRRVKSFVKKLLKKDIVSFIASDGHNINLRTTSLDKCYGYIVKKYGLNKAEKIFYDNPCRIVIKY